ncbi:hypothetical protein FOPG_18399 [Fusarium oxysporum f. sp. conglutinans race 2 54008]|uniref:Uncharacterized protein n=1 Tax=Fusarium oxysporum f. sp. conglutinans race 2 54008 TaxID=1089457 RepID=X0HW61_FUSOX|nr:hypothetical protein FOPG_18399 [Fusarium oxysporum f. sp. conglutinans race 2 54008]
MKEQMLKLPWLASRVRQGFLFLCPDASARIASWSMDSMIDECLPLAVDLVLGEGVLIARVILVTTLLSQHRPLIDPVWPIVHHWVLHPMILMKLP